LTELWMEASRALSPIDDPEIAKVAGACMVKGLRWTDPEFLYQARVLHHGLQLLVSALQQWPRALSDFAKLVEVFDHRGISFVSITQQFNTTTSVGRLTLNILLSFAQFERLGEAQTSLLEL
jgi:hypothetical protein